MSKPVVAVVGRPNVGKSTLFNRLIGRKLSIVEDTPGVTRDRVYSECDWRGIDFMMVDTGGIDPYSGEEFLPLMREQAQMAIDNADVIVLVTDIRAGATANDLDIATQLLKSRKPVILCVNRVDTLGEPPTELYDFYSLGLGDPFPVSALHGHGTGDLLDEMYKYLKEVPQGEEDEERIKVAIIGKPNVGKSSLVNKITGEQRMIVSPVAGTTRDAADSDFENSHGKFTFIDTAGIRKKSKVTEAVERYSVIRSYMAVDRSDVCVIMIDATVGITDQDSKVAGYANDQGKGCVIAVNKWDAIEKDDKSVYRFEESIREELPFMAYAPVVFISSVTGQRLDKLFELIVYVNEKNRTRIPTGQLNHLLAFATARVNPPTDKGKRLKIYYITQPSIKPPTFVAFVNSAELMHFSYQRYLENQLREMFTLDGTPVRWIIRERGRGE